MSDNMQKTILLVEDEVIIAMTERQQLEKEGYKVIHSFNGEKAIDLVCKNKEPIDLILMDIDLGKGLDGTETAKEILKLIDIPVLFLSSHTDKDVVEKTEIITNYGYIVKNSSFTVLDASIKMAFKLFSSKINIQSINNKLEATLKVLPDLVFEVGLDGCYYDVRSSQEELLIQPIPDLLGNKVSDLFPPDVSKIIMLAINEANETGISKGKQYEITVPAGKLWFELSVSRVASDFDNPHFMLICHDITERKISEEALEHRLSALTRPLGNGDCIEFEDLFNLDDIQNLQDAFARATGLASIITRTDGSPITNPSNFTRLCTDIIRKTEKGCENCIKSDAIIGSYSNNGPTIQTCLSGGLWDAGAGISIEDRHIANWLIGQVRDKSLTEENISMYAREIGADEKKVIAAFREIPVIQKERFEEISKLLYIMATQLSQIAYQNVQQAQFISHHKKVEETLRKSEERYHKDERISHLGNWEYDLKTKRLWGSDEAKRIFGLDPEKDDYTLEEPEKYILEKERVNQALRDLINEGKEYNLEYEINPKNKNATRIVTSKAEIQRDENGIPVSVVGVVQDITERKLAENKIIKLLSEKELILKEVHHRIKNNMSIMEALLRLQSDQANTEASGILQNAAGRIQSMSILYDKIYRSGNIGRLSLKDYATSLIEKIVAIFPIKVDVETKMEEITLDAKLLSSLGIIINELITNSMKYAFDNQDGLIKLYAFRKGNLVVLEYQDNGVGLPENVTFENSSGFGMQLVKILVDQIEGVIRIERGNGIKFVIEFEPGNE
jgi:PAS domain S-box-containing protein